MVALVSRPIVSRSDFERMVVHMLKQGFNLASIGAITSSARWALTERHVSLKRCGLSGLETRLPRWNTMPCKYV
jgi:hypothetical protein